MMIGNFQGHFMQKIKKPSKLLVFHKFLLRVFSTVKITEKSPLSVLFANKRRASVDLGSELMNQKYTKKNSLKSEIELKLIIN